MALSLMLTACGGNDYVMTHSFTAPTVNLITSVEDGSTIMSKGYYTFNLTTSAQTGTIGGQDILINNASMSFRTEEMAYSSPSLYEAIFKNVSTTTTGSLTYPLTNGNFLATPFYYFPGFFGINSPYNPSTAQGIPDIVVASYNLGDAYTVKTFQENTFYKGKTNTTYPFQGSVQNFTTEEIYYGLILNLADKKATIIMYNAKFSGVEAEPVKAQVILKDLTIDCTGGQITVKGENIIPEIAEGTTTTPYPSYTFDNIEYKTTSNDLTQATITYKVAGIYNGSFAGAYAETDYTNKQ